MGRKVKCRYCEVFLDKKNSLVIIEKTKSGKEKKVFLHKECEEGYKELMKYKENELKWFDILYKYIKTDILNYSKEQVLPKYLITQLQDLRNGTIMQKGKGRVIKCKEGYRYEIIINTFLKNGELIRWAIQNKHFKNEKQKINYIMAIINANINDTFIEMKNKKYTKKIENQQKLIDENNYKLNTKSNIKPKLNKGGIAKFLEDDEL